MSYFKFFILIIILLYTFSCNNDNCNSSCKSWQQCEELTSLTGEIEYKCSLIDGACENQNDCINGQFCNQHYCEWICSYPCNTWEVCNNKDECVKRDGYCKENSECDSGEKCSKISFKCEEKCPTPCKNWEICEDKECKSREKYCKNNTECNSGKKCNTFTHRCETKCFPSCKEWEHCGDNNQCITDNGRCDLEKGCNIGYSCTNDHVCKKDETTCNPPCYDYWKMCNENKCEKGDAYCEKNSDCQANQVCKKDHICHDKSDNNNEKFCETGEECTGNSSCNLSTHKCEEDPGNCTPNCKPWKKCNKDNTCVTNDGFCTEDSQCESGTCNLNHTCKDNNGNGEDGNNICNVDSDCKSWQRCKNNICVIKEDSCETGEECTENSSCNLSTHKCEEDLGNCTPNCKPWEECNQNNTCVTNDGFCTEDSQCESGNCNSNHICEDENNCILDSDCADWQKCKNNACVLDDGTCTQNSECPEGYNCNGTSCVPSCPTPCEYWQECKNSECVLKENHCDENNNTCSANQECNSEHICNHKCNPNCEPWQNCNNGVCENKNGFCTQNSDCYNGTCNIFTHKCQNNGNGNGNSCSVTCREWETCVNNYCQISPGRCDNNYAPCTAPLHCNEDHVCEQGIGCNDSCLYWQYCDSNGICKDKEGFCIDNSQCSENEYCDKICDENGNCTNSCKEKPKNCDPACENWQKCIKCRPEITCGNSNASCVCLKNEINKCIPKPGKCASNKDCTNGEKCDFVKHECSDQVFCEPWETLKSPIDSCNLLEGNEKTNCLAALNPDIACKDLTGDEKKECINKLNNLSKCELNFDRCEERTYCGPNSMCNLNNHYCEKLTNISCSTEYDIYLGNTCSLSYGNCRDDYDCPLNTHCGDNHSCEYKTCLNGYSCKNNSTCEYDFNGDGEYNSDYGFCKLNVMQDINSIAINNRNKVEHFNYLDSIQGIITHIQKSYPYNKIYISVNPYLNDSCRNNSECVEGYVCKTCDNKDRCPSNIKKFCSKNGSKYITNKNSLYNSLEVLSKTLKGSYDTQVAVGDNVMIEGYYLNLYGNNRFLSKKILFFNDLQCNEDSDCGGASLCKKLKYIDSEQKFCTFQRQYFNILDIGTITIAKGQNPNAAEGFENMFVSSFGEAPYTVVEDSSSSNGNKIKLRDANKGEFYISENFANLNLTRGKGQCVSKSCTPIRCPKYCADGYKTTDIDSDDINKKHDNCPNKFNLTQKDSDGDNKGDACDDDIDGDGKKNNEDICPTVYNPKQQDGTGEKPEGEEEAPKDPCVDSYENDKDKDGIKDNVDNCPNIFNPTQENLDKYLFNKGMGASPDDNGDVCDEDIDGDGLNNEDDPYDYTGTEPGCPMCNCAEPEDDCYNDSDCGNGECYYYKTALRTVKGILRYEPNINEKSCNSNSECASNKCLKFPNGEDGICCQNSSCTSNVKGNYSITPRSTSDYIKCYSENCADIPIPENWNTGI